MNKFAMIFALLCAITVVPTAEIPADKEAQIKRMVERRLSIGDLGMGISPMQLLYSDLAHKMRLPENKEIKIIYGKSTSNNEIPIRVTVLVTNNEFSYSAGDILIAVVDGVVAEDTFGTLGMTWNYNTDQSLIAIEEHHKANREAGNGDHLQRRDLHRFLKTELFPAQVQFQGGNYEDVNGNGIGDFAGDLEVLAGLRATKHIAENKLQLLKRESIEKLKAANIKYTISAENERGFYCFLAVSPKGPTLCIDARGMVREIPDVVLPTTVTEAKEVITNAKIVHQ